MPAGPPPPEPGQCPTSPAARLKGAPHVTPRRGAWEAEHAQAIRSSAHPTDTWPLVRAASWLCTGQVETARTPTHEPCNQRGRTLRARYFLGPQVGESRALPALPAGPVARPLTLDQLVVVVLQRRALLGHGRRPGSQARQPPLPQCCPRLRAFFRRHAPQYVTAARFVCVIAARTIRLRHRRARRRAVPGAGGPRWRRWRWRRVTATQGLHRSCWWPGIP